MIIIILIFFCLGIYLGMTEKPRMDYSEVWEKLKNDT